MIVLPIKDVPHNGQWLDPSHNHQPLKQRNDSWKPGGPKGAGSPEFGEVHTQTHVQLVGGPFPVPWPEVDYRAPLALTG